MGNIEAAEDKVDWTARPVQSLQDAQDAFVWVVRHYYYFDREERLARSEEIDKNIARYFSMIHHTFHSISSLSN